MNGFIKEERALCIPPKLGEIAEGEVLEKEKGALYLDLGFWGTGIVYGKEFRDTISTIKELKPGDKILVKIVDLENEDGFIEVSLKEAGQELIWENIKKKQEKGEVLKVKITNANKGGLMAEISGITAFLPTSQLGSKYYPKVEEGEQSKILEALRKLIGEELTVKIIDADSSQEKLIISEKAAIEEETKELLSKYKVGDIIEGKVTGIVNFGVFVEFPVSKAKSDLAKVKKEDKLEGLIHISELAWRLVENPSDVVKVGEKIKVKIIGIQGGRVSLSLKALKQNPWQEFAKKHKKGDLVKAKVIKFSPYGAFVRISENLVGLVHISEFGSQKRMQEQLETGKEYNFKILLIDAEEHKVALALAF